MSHVALMKLAAIVLLFYTGEGYADQLENPCDSPFRIYFGNGILNTPIDWIASRQELEMAVGPKYLDMPVSYGNAYNASGGFISDLATVFQQKISENPSLSWELLARIFLGLTADLDPVLVKAVRNLISSTEQKSTVELKQQFEANYAFVDQKVVDQVSAFTDDITNHSLRVLVVGHSQGNLYANASYKLLYTNPASRQEIFS
jgi:hypothetical protein